MDSFICPHCKKTVEISDALKHQIKEQVLEGQKEERENWEKEIQIRLEKKIKEEFEFEKKNAVNELLEAKERNKQLQEQLLELNKTMRDLRDQNERKELENEKKLNEQIEKIKEEATKTASEKARLKELELEKKLTDTQKALEDAQRKSQQGSQQLQGEVMELDLEQKLKSTFVFDEFCPIPKGIEGADIWQKVKNKHGQIAGSIVWEIKRTKAFSQGWLAKLREDARKINASICILVTEVMPDGVKHFERQSGVWICSQEYAVLLANVLRDSLLQVAIAKSAASHKDDKLQEIYDYIVSEAFRHKMEAHFESVQSLKDDLDIEKRSTERMWKKREIQIQRLDKSMSQMFGELQGIAGPALPSIKNLTLESGEEKNEIIDQTGF